MLRKLLRKITGKRSAVEMFLEDRAWTIREAPLDSDDMVDFDGVAGVITVNVNLPDAMRRDVLAVLTANPVDANKHNVNANDAARIKRLSVKAKPR